MFCVVFNISFFCKVEALGEIELATKLLSVDPGLQVIQSVYVVWRHEITPSYSSLRIWHYFLQWL